MRTAKQLSDLLQQLSHGLPDQKNTTIHPNGKTSMSTVYVQHEPSFHALVEARLHKRRAAQSRLLSSMHLTTATEEDTQLSTAALGLSSEPRRTPLQITLM